MSGWNQEQEYQAGAKDERERIIKLLEEQGCDCHNAYCDKLPTAALNSLIALIKKENNG
jgi:hypothetical protein